MEPKQRALNKLAAARRAGERAREQEAAAVQSAIAAGASWQEIADALGVTKQTAHRKHGKRPHRPKG